MARSANAEIAVEMYDALANQFAWSAATAWYGIARLLLTCDIWKGSWQPFHNLVVYRDSNDFGDPIVIKRARSLSDLLALELGVPSSSLCQAIGTYWRHPQIANLQPHNLVGNAFRSLTAHILKKYGSQHITYEEEVNAYSEFPGHQFSTRSQKPKIDIVARKNQTTVALLSCRWRFRHDRVDMVDEAIAYAPAARRQNPNCQLYANIGEFSPSRIDKVIKHCPPASPHGALNATIHFAPHLITNGLQQNGRMTQLQSLDWLISQTFSW